MDTKKLIWTIASLAILGLLVAGYFYFPRPAKKEVVSPPTEKKGAVGAAEKVSEGVPKITTNPAEKIPEVNPLDRANPFKYTNPLR